MAGPISLRTEIFGSLHQAGPEVMLPEMIDGDPTDQWIVRMHEPFGETETVWRTVRWEWEDGFRHARRNLLPMLLEVATHQEECIPGLFHLLHDHSDGDAGDKILLRLALCFEDFTQILDLRNEGLAVIAL